MEHSTVIFVLTLSIAFVFLRWLITPIPPSLPFETTSNESTASSSGTRNPENGGSTATNRRNRREVSDSMIEVVQAIAPQLTPQQIRYDLQRTGSVEVTIENFMETGTLPFPPGESPNVHLDEDSEGHNHAPTSTADPNLIAKYHLESKVNEDVEDSQNKGKWASSKEERSDILSRRREEMILKARKRLASQLQNEI